MTDMQTFGVTCNAASHKSKKAVVGLLARHPETGQVKLWPILPKGVITVQRIDESDQPFEYMNRTDGGTPDAWRSRVEFRCPLCGLSVVRRWPDAKMASIVEAGLDSGESEVSLRLLAAMLA